MPKGILIENIETERIAFYAIIIDRASESVKRGKGIKKRLHPLYKNGSNGYEDRGYALKRHLLRHGNLERWVKAKNRNGKYNPIEIELREDIEAQLFKAFELSIKDEKDPFLEVFKSYNFKKYNVSIQNLVLMFNYYHADSINYFVTDEALAQISTDPQNVSDKDIGFLLSKPNANLIKKEDIINGGRYIFAMPKERMVTREIEPIEEQLDHLTSNLYESSEKVTYRQTECEKRRIIGIGRIFGLI